MRFILPAMLLIVGVIHLLPLLGVLSANRLQLLYGIVIEDPNLEILMRHRAVLFGLLGAFLITAAFMPSLQLAALAVGFASVASFLYLAAAVGNFNEQVNRVVIADKVAVICLVVGAVAYVMSRLNADQT
jgi:hypothetical protein